MPEVSRTEHMTFPWLEGLHWLALVQLAFNPKQTHCPLWHVPDEQTMPQAPQLLGSLLRSLQLPLQQAGVVPVHVVPQEPQLLVVFRLVQVPLQQPCPEEQQLALL